MNGKRVWRDGEEREKRGRLFLFEFVSVARELARRGVWRHLRLFEEDDLVLLGMLWGR